MSHSIGHDTSVLGQFLKLKLHPLNCCILFSSFVYSVLVTAMRKQYRSYVPIMFKADYQHVPIILH